MESLAGITSTRPVDPITLNASSSTASTNSFSQQLLSALDSFLGKSGNGSQIEINVQPAQGQNSAAGQYIVTLTDPAAATAATSANPSASLSASVRPAASPAASAAPAVTTMFTTPVAPAAAAIAGPAPAAATPADTITTSSGLTVSSLPDQLQALTNSWSVLTPSQVAFQLANAAGTGGGAPTATVPGTTFSFGQLNQAQQLAYQYGTDFGTGNLSMQDFLTQNAGPSAAWNLSYNQIQANPDIQAAADSSYQALASGVPMPIQAPSAPSTPQASSGNLDNLPNPALIQYLPQNEQAAAEAAVLAEGPYGANIAAAAQAYA